MTDRATAGRRFGPRLQRATGQARAAGSPLLGWLLGAGEVVLASAMVLHRSWTTGAALALFALGLSAAGTIGVMSGGRLSCACFGQSDRALEPAASVGAGAGGSSW